MPGYSKQKSGSWVARWDIAPHPLTGKRRQRQSPPQPTRKAAREWYEEHIAGKHLDYSTLTVGDYLERWIAGHRYRVRPSSAVQYERAIRNHLVPHLGHIRLRDLKADAIRAWHAAEIAAGYQSVSIAAWHVVLATALNQAVKDELIPASPARHAAPPPVPDTTPPHWTPEEIHQFLDACPVSLSGQVFRFALLTGMRPGEISALEWSAVDLDAGVVRVEATETLDADGKRTIGPPKTSESRRRVVMPAMLRDELRAYRRLLIEHRLSRGAGWDTTRDYVFPTRSGKRNRGDYWNERLRRFCVHIGITPLTMHGLRHSWATWMLALREHHAIVGAQLGHKSVTTTIDTYSHVTEAMQREAAARLDEDLRQRGA